MFHMSSGAVRETNPKCTFKTVIANDRAEPTIVVQLGQLVTITEQHGLSQWSVSGINALRFTTSVVSL